MKSTVNALKALYVKLGGSLTDTYAGIADGASVGNYTNIPDVIEAVNQKAASGGGGDSGVFCVHATIAPVAGTATVTEDIEDIVSAVASEKIVFVLSNGDFFHMTVGDISDTSAPYLEFSKMEMEKQGSGQYTIGETKVTYDSGWSSSYVTGTFSE